MSEPATDDRSRSGIEPVKETTRAGIEPAKEEVFTALGFASKMAIEHGSADIPTIDDPSTSAFTFRVIFLGSIWAIFYASADTVFSFRTNPFNFPPAIVNVLVYPMGTFLAKLLPTRFLNPGPFTLKEHFLITIIAGTAGGIPHGVDNVVMQYSDFFLGDNNVNIWNSMAWIATAQLIAFGTALVLKRYLVKPAIMFWPEKLSTLALMTTMNNVCTAGSFSQKYTMSRYRFFIIVSSCFFLYMLVPLHFCSTIASISILCLVSKNRTLRFLGSAGDGAGLFAFSLDYTIIGGEKAFVSPFWVTCNLVGAKIFWEWFIAPICFFTNVWGNPQLQTNYFYPDGEPFGKIECFMIGVLNSNQIFNGSGAPIKLERPSKSNTSTGYNNILKQDFTLDIEKYNLHKPLYITEMNALSIFSVFIGMTSTITFIILWYGADIIDWAKSTNDDDQPEDVHDRLMKNYYHLSEYLTMSLLLLFILFTIIICEVIPFTIPYWASVLSILVGMLFTFVSGFMKALTGARVTNMLFAELIIGYILPGIFITYLLGNTITCSAFTSLSRNIQRQAVEILGDMKLAHYLHVPPLAMFTCQLYGLTVGYIVNTLSTFYVLDVMTEPKVFHDPAWLGIIYVRFVSYHAGIWGAIGPYRFFGSGTPYFSLYYGIIIGIFLPFIPWLLNKRFPSIVWHLLNPCLMFCNMEVGTIQASIVIQFVTGFIFQHYIFVYRKEWFDKYLYILTASLSFGTGMAILFVVIFLSQFPAFTMPDSIFNPENPDWYCFDGSPYNITAIHARPRIR